MKETKTPEFSLDNAVEILDLERLTDPRGNLTFVEGGRHIPLMFSGFTICTTFLRAKPGADMHIINCSN